MANEFLENRYNITRKHFLGKLSIGSPSAAVTHSDRHGSHRGYEAWCMQTLSRRRPLLPVMQRACARTRDTCTALHDGQCDGPFIQRHEPDARNRRGCQPRQDRVEPVHQAELVAGGIAHDDPAPRDGPSTGHRRRLWRRGLRSVRSRIEVIGVNVEWRAAGPSSIVWTTSRFGSAAFSRIV